MALSRDMKRARLQKNVGIRSESGAKKTEWKEKADIIIAIYKKDEMRMYASETYKESTHCGLTYCRDIEEGNRILQNGRIYIIKSANTESRLTNLLLKVVE